MTKTSTAAWTAILSFALGVAVALVGMGPEIRYVPIDPHPVIITETTTTK